MQTKPRRYRARFEDNDLDAPAVRFVVEAHDLEQARELAFLALDREGYDSRDYTLTRMNMIGADQ